ncbi:hypothetical protein AAEO57_17260 [Flavobacterium sp. DGU38]|uniref:Uncharacterized protein n=1 Tax=Flavobacterium calami TaxID=3139144 RepID=A0ABU9ISV7_9FLAO
MEDKPEYIEFSIGNEVKFNDMKNVYELIAQAKNSGQPKPEGYWLKVFPEYSLKHFYFLDSDIKPEFVTAKRDNNNWHFAAMINLLQTDLEVELIECKRIGNKGRIEFSAYSYPYGGITGLTMFLNSFDCKAFEIDEGGGVYSVHWNSDCDFKLNEIVTPVNSSLPKSGRIWWQKLFGVNKL